MKPLTDRLGSIAAAFALVAVLAVPVRMSSEHSAELSAARAATTAGDHVVAIDHFRRALRWSLPLTDQEDEALEGLENIATDREAAGDRETALLAWRSVVGGLSSRRTLYDSPNPTAERAKDAIARLAVGDADARRYRILLDRRIAPDPLGGSVLVLGFLVWLVSLVLIIQRGFDPLGRAQLARARGPLLGAFAGFASFVVGLLLA